MILLYLPSPRPVGNELRVVVVRQPPFGGDGRMRHANIVLFKIAHSAVDDDFMVVDARRVEFDLHFLRVLSRLCKQPHCPASLASVPVYAHGACGV